MYKMVITNTETGEVVRELTGDAIAATVAQKEQIYGKATACLLMKARTPADIMAVRRHVSRLKIELVKRAREMADDHPSSEQIFNAFSLGCKNDDAQELVQSGFATEEQGKAMQEAIMKELFDTDPMAKRLKGLIFGGGDDEGLPSLSDLLDELKGLK